jgi:hypothetical protein
MKIKDVYPYTAKIPKELLRNRVEASYVNTKGKDLFRNLKLYHSSTNNGFNITADIAYQVESTGIAEPIVHTLDQIPILSKRVISTLDDPKLDEDICNL